MERRRAELIVDRLLEDLEDRLPVETDTFLRDIWIDIVDSAFYEPLDPPERPEPVYH